MGDQADLGRPSSSQSTSNGSSSHQSKSRRRSLPSNSCHTKLEPLRLSQQWRVDNFAAVMKLSKPGVCLRSQVFKDSVQFPEACWQLCLYPGGKREENVNNVSLFLKMSATTPSKEVLLKAEYRFYFLDDNDEPKFSNVNIGDFHAKPPKGGHSWGLRNIPRPKVCNALRKDQSLVILCEIELIPDPNKVRCVSDRLTAMSPSDMHSVPNSYVDAFRRLLNESTMSDCVIHVTKDNRDIKVHKCVLATHSDVFNAMFSHSGCTESTTSKIVIEDFGADAVQAFLNYIYTGSVSDDFNVLVDLIGLSEKYALNDLKRVCQDQLGMQLSTSNVCHLLVHAELFGADTLFGACIEYIKQRGHVILNTDEWHELKQCNPALVNIVLEEIVQTDLQARMGDQPPQKKMRRPSTPNND